MPKRAPFDPDQFKIELPAQPIRDPLDSIIPTAPPSVITSSEPKNVPPSVQTPIRPRLPKRPKLHRKTNSKQSGNHAITLSSYPDSRIESIRKAVRFVGKDPFFGRFTPEEKNLLADIAYNHKRKGVKTSENEIARIAVNFIVHDYQEKGKNSILSRVLEALNT